MNNDYAVNTECPHAAPTAPIPESPPLGAPMPRRPSPGSSRPRVSPSRSAQTASRLAASLLVVLVLAALATVLGEVLLDGLPPSASSAAAWRAREGRLRGLALLA